MHRLASLTIGVVMLTSMAGCSTCQRWLGHGHGQTGAPCPPQAFPAMAPAYPAPYAGHPVVTDPNLVMPAPQ